MSMLSTSLDEVTDYIFNKLVTDKGTLGVTIGGDHYEVQDVWYSDQETIPRTPAICVEPGVLDREDSGPTLNTVNNFEVLIIVYSSIAVTGGANSVPQAERNRRIADRVLENVAKDLHGDIRLGGTQGLVTYGFFTRSQSGYAVRGGNLLRASRGLWRGKNKTPLV